MDERKFHWTFCTADIDDPNDSNKKASAFAVNGKESVAYGDAQFAVDKADDKGLYNGFSMTYTSKENDKACVGEEKKSKVIFHVNCKPENTGEPKFDFKKADSVSCQYEYTTEHLAGCGIDASVILGLMKFIGIIAIVCGLALTFAGSKFIPIVIGFLVGTGIFLTCFVIGAIVITGTGAAIGLSVVGLILGGVAGYFSGKFVEDYGIQMIAFAAGGIVVFILASTIP